MQQPATTQPTVNTIKKGRPKKLTDDEAAQHKRDSVNRYRIKAREAYRMMKVLQSTAHATEIPPLQSQGMNSSMNNTPNESTMI